MHVDLEYQAGKSNNCGKVICCRSDSIDAKTPEEVSGIWGDFNCDIPIETVHHLFKFMKDELKPDVVMWAGDSIAHNLDTITYSQNVRSMIEVTQAVKNGLQGIPVYAAIGNHDTYPQDTFKGHNPRENKAINDWDSAWEDFGFLQEPEQLQHFLDYGFYSAPFKFANGTNIGKNNTRVIHVNANYCYQFNFELMSQFYDPGHMLEWLESELAALEAINGNAIIFSHVPNIDECTRQFSLRWHALMDRYQTVIKFGVHGHVHKEQWQVQRDFLHKKPIGVNFIAGSITTFIGKPPSFNVLYIDPELLIPVEYETYSFDLVKANQKGHSPEWQIMYNYTETFGMKDLSPLSFLNYADSILKDEMAAKKFRNHRFIDHTMTEDSCDYKCRRWHYCQAVSNDYDDWMFCNDNNLFDMKNAPLLTIE